MNNLKHLFIKSLILMFVVTALGSCSDRPSNVLKEKELVALMVDMELTESYLNTQTGLTPKEKEALGKRLLATHGVSEESLDTTLAWYGRNMDEYSELFEKVDKEINKRRQKYTEIEGETKRESDDLWTYGQHILLSPLSGYEAVTFSIPHPEIQKGDVVKLSFYLPNSTNLKNVLGVEYQDGYSEALTNNSSKNKVEMSLQTDSSKVVSRIYGSFQIKDKKSLPLLIDSLTLRGESIDTLNYRSKRRSQKIIGPF